MKKENRKMAQEQRAKARKKQKIMRIVKYCSIGLGSVLVLGLLVQLINWSTISKENEAANTNTTSTPEASSESTAEPTLLTDKSLVVEDGMTVNIDFVGSIDGVEFEGGNTHGMGSDLKIGSHTFIDDFEEQLIGHHIGDTVDVVVTFPENYGNVELAGKEALFVTVINGIYE